MNISYILILLFMLYIYNKDIYSKKYYNQECFNSAIKLSAAQKIRIDRDIYNSIFNIYNPYTINTSTLTVSDIMKKKCYFNIKPDYLINLNADKYANMSKISNLSNVQTIQFQYITEFFNNIFNISKTDELYIYYNQKLMLPLIYNELGKYFIKNNYDNMSFLELLFIIFVNEKLTYFISNIDANYNIIMSAADYLLTCIKKKNNEKYKNITLNTSVYYIKNFVIYDNDDDYFNTNFLFSCVK